MGIALREAKAWLEQAGAAQRDASLWSPAAQKLASLVAEIEAAPVAEVTREDWLENFRDFGPDLIGQRVRLLPEGE